MKQSTIRLLVAVAEAAMQVRRSNLCSHKQIYAALDALYDLYDIPYLDVGSY
ncbi:hypothetical protein LCGC14_1049850 [marine sediment metagenome]|uniref:Uncharacterized protein n=1 Tax=marine sediment metagenome TaxID=412755 RepID=A0A0F9Q796_9ZZZZ